MYKKLTNKEWWEAVNYVEIKEEMEYLLYLMSHN